MTHRLSATLPPLTKRRLKTSIVRADPTRGAYIFPMAFGYSSPSEPTIEFYDEDGRRHLVVFSAAQVEQLGRWGEAA